MLCGQDLERVRIVQAAAGRPGVLRDDTRGVGFDTVGARSLRSRR